MEDKPLWKDPKFLEKLRRKLLRLSESQLPQKSEDITHEAIVIFLENLSRGYYRGPKNEYGLIGYGIGILKHLIIKEIKGLKGKIFLSFEDKKTHENIFSREEEEFIIQIEEEKKKSKILEIARKEMDEFPPEIKELIYLHVFKNWSYSKLSNHFGIPKQTLVYKFNTAMEKLRKKIKIFIQFGEFHTQLHNDENSKGN